MRGDALSPPLLLVKPKSSTFSRLTQHPGGNHSICVAEQVIFGGTYCILRQFKVGSWKDSCQLHQRMEISLSAHILAFRVRYCSDL